MVLLDEVEKAHPEVFNILLQILEDGHLSDAKGRRVDFRNAIIIMTSNLGAKQLQTNSSLGFRAMGSTDANRAESSYELMKEKVAAELKQNFRPEFLNRIDATVVFRSLTVEEIAQIVDLMLARVRDQLRAQQMQLEVTEAAKEHIIKLGYDVAYGARPLRRVIQNMIEDVLAEHLLLGKYEPGSTIVVDKDPEAGLDIHLAEPPSRAPRSRRGDAAPPRRRPSDGAAPEPLRLPVLRGVVPSLGRPVPRLRPAGTPWSRRSSTNRHGPSEPSPAARASGPPRRPGWRPSPTPTCLRLPVGIAEFDRVLGGGLVPGSLVLVGGEPGIGKSTLLLQAAAGLTRDPAGAVPVLYATGEESPGQVRLRAARLGLLAGPSAEGVRVLAEHDVGRIVEAARAERPGLVIVDSIQTATVDELDGAAGSVGQVREATLRLMDLAKGDGIAVILVGHVTKDGAIAGPKTLEHLVDAVISLEGERYAALRLLRATKNRFGSTDEVGVFEMAETGLSRGRRSCPGVPRGPWRIGPGQRRGADPGGQPAVARGGPGAGQPDRLRHPDTAGERPRRRTASASSSRSSAGEPGSPSAATTCTPTWPAGCRSPSRRWTSPSPSRWPRRRGTGRSRRGPWRSARSACSASSGRSSGWNAGCARPPASGSTTRSSRPARRARSPVRIDGLGHRPGRRASVTPSRPPWPTDRRLVARRSPRC